MPALNLGVPATKGPQAVRNFGPSIPKGRTQNKYADLTGGLSFNGAGGAGYYRTLTVDHTQVPSTQTDFPVLVSITDATLKTVGNGGRVQSSSGYDIVFCSDSAGLTRLKWEMESYDAVNGIVVAHVKIASLSSGSDTVFYMFYGDPSITTDQSDSANTWDATFNGVWHMADNAASTAIHQSTATAGADGVNVANTSTKTATGQIGNALTYNGTSDAASAAINLSATRTVTLSFWMKWTTNANNDHLAFEYTANFNSNNGILADWNAASGFFSFGFHDTLFGYRTDHFTRPSAGAWHLVHLFIDRTDDTKVNKAYVDGTLQTLTTDSHNTGAIPSAFDNSTLYFMSRNKASLFAAGVLDEVRLSTIERAQDWVTSEFNNQKPSSTFLTLGSETPLSSGVILFKRIGKILSGVLSFIGSLATFLNHVGGTAFFQALTGTLSFGTRIDDFYSESNQNSAANLSSAVDQDQGIGQAFTSGGGTLDRAQFYLKKDGSPTGNAVAKLYAISGTFGTNAIPSGAALATSDNFDVSTLTTSYALATFTFSGANRYAMANGTNYCITVEYSGGNNGNDVSVGIALPGAHSGNIAILFSGAWGGNNSFDASFYVYVSTTGGGGSLTKRTGKALSAALSFVGAYARTISKAVSGALSFIGALTKSIQRAFTAALSFVGAITKRTTHTFAGTLSFVGVGARTALKALAGTLSFVGSIIRRTAHGMTAALSFIGALTKFSPRAFTGSLSFIGSVVKRTGHNATATLSFIGNLSRSISRAFTAALSFIGSLTKRTSHAFTAALSFIGSLAASRTARLALTATLSFVGNLTKSTRHAFTAALSFVGSLIKRTAHSFTGTLSFIGVGARTALKSFSGALSFVGAIKRNVFIGLASVLSFLGNLGTFLIGGAQQFSQSLTSTLEFSGDITRRTFKALAAAALSFVGSLTKRTAHSFAGALSFIGSVATRLTSHLSLTATLSFAGSLTRSIRRSFTGALSFIGSLATHLFAGAVQYFQALTGSLSFSGSTSKRTSHAFSAALSFIGSTLRRAGKVFSGTLSFDGTIRRAVSITLSSVLSFSGRCAKGMYQAFTATLSFIGNLLTELNPAELFLMAFEATLNFSSTMRRRISVGLASVLRFIGFWKFHRLARHICRVFSSGARNPGFPDHGTVAPPSRTARTAPSGVVSPPDREARTPPDCR